MDVLGADDEGVRVVDSVSDVGPDDVPSPVDAVADVDVPPDPPVECAADADCPGAECSVGVCDADGSCQFDVAPDGTECAGGSCEAGACIGFEPIGAGFTGGQCAAATECAPAGSVCIPGVYGGSCAIPCEVYCDDQAGAPTTFCIDALVYESRLQEPLAAELFPALCVAKCDYRLFPRTGCRDGLHCEQRNRYGQSVRDEVCVPGKWSIGLAVHPESGEVLGLEASEPASAEPWSRLLEAHCGGEYQPLDGGLFRGLADTLMAMGGDGHDRDWERLCASTGLPDVFDLGVEAAAGRAFKLTGSRLQVVDWTAQGLYGSKKAQGVLHGGPLFPLRAMVHRAGSAAYLYADGAPDHPYADPERGRHFGWIDGQEWTALDTQLVPHAEYVTIKADGTHAFYRQWARVETINYIADMATDHLAWHGLPLGVGDFSLPTGGDIDGHGSHETGLDVDLYILSFPLIAGALAFDQPRLWVAECSSAGGWSCSYHDDKTGLDEPFADPNHVPAAEQLTTLAQFAYDTAGASHFVQHDVEVLAPFAQLPGNTPKYVDASNASTQGWPPHKNHIHVRFFK